MTMRALIDAVITEDVELTAIIPVDRWREADRDDVTPTRPFAEYRWGLASPSVKSTSQIRSQVLEVWIHDERGSFDININPVIERLRKVLDAAVGRVESDGTSLMAADWAEDGPYAYDNGHETSTRYSRYRIVGTGI